MIRGGWGPDIELKTEKTPATRRLTEIVLFLISDRPTYFTFLFPF